ncbi:MAG: hypothetical protein AAGG48_32305 [Planctomycetota bacterium]
MNAHCLDAPPSLFDEVDDIFAASDLCAVERHRESRVKGVRRLDTAEFDVADDSCRVDVLLERRLGNNRMSVIVAPRRKWFSRRGHDSELLARRVVDLLVQHKSADNQVVQRSTA